MKKILINCEDIAAPFMEMYCESPGAFKVGRALALVELDDDTRSAEMIACVWYEGWNGVNMNIHVAAKPGKRWMTREFLHATFHYPFDLCGAKRLTGLVASNNFAAQRFDEHIGFKLEARLKDAAPGGDLLVYAMFRDECRWLGLKPKTTQGMH